MSTDPRPASLVEVQTLLDAYERRTSERHIELIDRFKQQEDRFAALEMRLRQREIEAAAQRPIIKGATGTAVMIFTALVAGYVGSLFT